jgi:phosphoglycolate phosphatase-like HAD superfamily hydrolase
MQLAVFDIDGTLTRTVGLCDGMFGDAIAAAAGVASVRLDWSLYPDATDSGIAAAHFHRDTGRFPDAVELARIRERFVASLRAAKVRAAPVEGAGDVLARVAADPEWRVAIATGNWRACAAIKFEWSGLAWPDVPLAAADDAPERAAILRIAVARAGGPFERVVYLGDGPHDVRAARAAGAAFVGVTAVRDESSLRAAGARTFLDHFGDPDRVREALDRATIPEDSASGR